MGPDNPGWLAGSGTPSLRQGDPFGFTGHPHRNLGHSPDASVPVKDSEDNPDFARNPDMLPIPPQGPGPKQTPGGDPETPDLDLKNPNLTPT